MPKPTKVIGASDSPVLFIQARGVFEERADWAPSVQAPHTPLAAPSYLLKTRAAKSSTPFPSGKGPEKSKTEPLPVIGRAISSAARRTSHCDLGGAAFALHHARKGTKQRHGRPDGRTDSAGSQTLSVTAALADLRPRAGDGQRQNLHFGHEPESLFL
jgi:hypothetical protein